MGCSYPEKKHLNPLFRIEMFFCFYSDHVPSFIYAVREPTADIFLSMAIGAIG